LNRLSYLDFDLLFENLGEEYEARVLASPAGQAISRFTLPFGPVEIENLLLRVGRARRRVRRLESPEMEAARIFGSRLFTAVFNGEVLSCLRGSQAENARQGSGLRLRLRLSATPELGNLPWEFLYDPTRGQFLSLSTETPVIRYLELAQQIPPLPLHPPLQVLVMISSPQDYPQLDVEKEWARLNEALADLVARGLVALTCLDKATLGELQRLLRRGGYHIFHFIGHGAFDERSQDGVLLTEDEQGRGRLVSGFDLGTLLHDHRSLRLAVLNACEGARSSLNDPFAGSAQSLVQKGLPAVVAMQFEISDEAAITLAHELYGALADGFPADAALAEARKAVFAQDNDVEWATPVLYTRVPDTHVFQVESASAALHDVVGQFFNRGVEAASQADWQAAAGYFEEVLRLWPEHREAAVRLDAAREKLALEQKAGPNLAAPSAGGIETRNPAGQPEPLEWGALQADPASNFSTPQPAPKTKVPARAPAPAGPQPLQRADRSRTLILAAGAVGVLLAAFLLFRWLYPPSTPTAEAQPTQPSQPLETSAPISAEEQEPQVPLTGVNSLEELEALLLEANVRLSEPEDLERTRSYFTGPDAPYHRLAVAVLQVLDGRRFIQPVNLDIVDKWYTQAAGSGYAYGDSLDLELVEQSLIDAHNDYYVDDATSLESLIEP